MPHRKLGIDLDGVVANFTRGFTTLAKEMGKVPNAWDCKDQDVWLFNTPPAARDIKEPAWRFNDHSVWEELRQRYNWWMTMPPLLTVGEVNQLNEAIAEHNIYFITSRIPTLGYTAEKQSELWLESIGVNVHGARVLGAKAGHKGLLCHAIGIEAFIDDHLANLLDLEEHNVTAICREWQYNKEWKGPSVESLGRFLFYYCSMEEPPSWISKKHSSFQPPELSASSSAPL